MIYSGVNKQDKIQSLKEEIDKNKLKNIKKLNQNNEKLKHF